MVSTVNKAFFITTLPMGSTPSQRSVRDKTLENHNQPETRAHALPIDGTVCACACTWPVGAGLLGVEFGSQGGARLQLGFGELGQVGHDGVLVHIGVHDLFRGDHLAGQQCSC